MFDWKKTAVYTVDVTKGQLVDTLTHRDQGCDRPRGVCVTRSGRLVVAWCTANDSAVTGYNLK